MDQSDVRLLLGDCLDRMIEIEDQSVDLIACDLPYQITECKWDTLIPFNPLWSQYKRILKPRGSAVLTASQPFTSRLVASNEKWFRYCMVWEKNGGANAMNAQFQPIKVHEDVVVFSASSCGNGSKSPMVYNPQGLIDCRRKNHAIDGGDTDFHRPGRKLSSRDWMQTKTGYPNSVIYFPKDTPRVHPTQKPVALFEYLIRTYSNEGDTVLDNAMGSGTTGVACVNTKRKFIGIEKEEKYFEIAKSRIDAAMNPPAEEPKKSKKNAAENSIAT